MEATTYLTREHRARLQIVLVAGGTLVCAATLFMSGSLARLGWTRYSDSPPLDLPGAENLRLPENLASTMRTLAQNSVAHGDMLFSLPGVYSFHQWTGLPTPTLANATHWFSLLNVKQQAEIAAVLAHDPRPVIIVERGVLDFLRQGNIPVTGPLYDFIQANFTRVFSLEEYEFWIRRGRVIAPVNRAELLESRAGSTEVPRWRLTAMVFTGGPIVAVELMQLDGTPKSVARFSAVNARLAATPVRLDGQAVGATILSAWGRPLPALAQLTIDITGALPQLRRALRRALPAGPRGPPRRRGPLHALTRLRATSSRLTPKGNRGRRTRPERTKIPCRIRFSHRGGSLSSTRLFAPVLRQRCQRRTNQTAGNTATFV